MQPRRECGRAGIWEQREGQGCQDRAGQGAGEAAKSYLLVRRTRGLPAAVAGNTWVQDRRLAVAPSDSPAVPARRQRGRSEAGGTDTRTLPSPARPFLLPPHFPLGYDSSGGKIHSTTSPPLYSAAAPGGTPRGRLSCGAVYGARNEGPGGGGGAGGEELTGEGEGLPKSSRDAAGVLASRGWGGAWVPFPRALLVLGCGYWLQRAEEVDASSVPLAPAPSVAPGALSGTAGDEGEKRTRDEKAVREGVLEGKGEGCSPYMGKKGLISRWCACGGIRLLRCWADTSKPESRPKNLALNRRVFLHFHSTTVK
ncbi:uncharacterized protein LOC135188510 [Pogoniulus pusillus]|uniref:uncharacterized protein LOC135188510 n=1 Tax=Pogoniulus pusillus TaxID=488313 RepID=UPI0030B9870F